VSCALAFIHPLGFMQEPEVIIPSKTHRTIQSSQLFENLLTGAPEIRREGSHAPKNVPASGKAEP